MEKTPFSFHKLIIVLSMGMSTENTLDCFRNIFSSFFLSDLHIPINLINKIFSVISFPVGFLLPFYILTIATVGFNECYQQLIKSKAWNLRTVRPLRFLILKLNQDSKSYLALKHQEVSRMCLHYVLLQSFSVTFNISYIC